MLVAHVGNRPIQKLGKERLFFIGEVLNHLLVNVIHGFVHVRMALLTLWENVNALAALILGIQLELNERLLFQAVQNSGSTGMAQVKGFLKIFCQRRLALVADKRHSTPLGGG